MKYSDRVVKKICKTIRELKGGRTIAAQMAGVSYMTFVRWFKAHPEFREAVELAELEAASGGEDLAKKSIFAAMEDKNHWQAAAWWLERTNPNKYGKQVKIDQQLTTNNDKLPATLSECFEAIERINGRRSELLAEFRSLQEAASREELLDVQQGNTELRELSGLSGGRMSEGAEPSEEVSIIPPSA